MAYTYHWTPETQRPTHKSIVKIRTWDGQKPTNTASQIVDGEVVITVPEKNRYKISIRTGPVIEEATVNIPRTRQQLPLAQRVEEIEETLGSGLSAPTAIIPDPDNEGFFIIVTE